MDPLLCRWRFGSSSDDGGAQASEQAVDEDATICSCLDPDSHSLGSGSYNLDQGASALGTASWGCDQGSKRWALLRSDLDQELDSQSPDHIQSFKLLMHALLLYSNIVAYLAALLPPGGSWVPITEAMIKWWRQPESDQPHMCLVLRPVSAVLQLLRATFGRNTVQLLNFAPTWLAPTLAA